MDQGPPTPGNVYVIDDDGGLCSSIGMVLTSAGYRARTWTLAEEFLAGVPDAAPAVVIIDMCMPSISGLRLHAALIAQGRTMPVIYISGETTVPEAIEAMKLGALEFLVKPFTREQLLAAVAAGVERDWRDMQARIKRARFDEALAILSPREREVHALLLQGFSNAEIMQRLNVGLATAKQYKAQLMRKMGVRSMSELMRHAAPSRH